ncbi:SPFH domain-containing protein [Massilia sp. PWRC2]|uniref:SPFH domain-containing protein n=1 Tax=Massilia sp. PWRC2 TaxID=2804626 RepID=UPI003CEB1FC7
MLRPAKLLTNNLTTGTVHMAFIDRVKWDGSAEQLAWKYPSQELSTFTQLIVNDTQVAFVVREGVYDGPFEAGRHTLSSNNIPMLRQLIGLPFGGKSPFTAEVWFVNRLVKLDVRWGTPDPITLQDPKFGVMVPVRAFGQYGIEVVEPRQFLMKLVGTLSSFDAGVLAAYFRGMLTTRIKSAIASAIIDSGLSVLEVATQLAPLSAHLQDSLTDIVDDYGVALTRFCIESINVPEDDSAVRQLKAALARRAEMQIVGYDYQQARGFDVLQTAAANHGAGALVGVGVGAGVGVAAGAAIGRTFDKLLPAPALSASADRLQLLQQLGQLRHDQVLTEAEFEAEKRRLLGA